jgi:SecD/SecF fusion protein
MAFGIVVAAASSVFIAAPLLLFLGDWRSRRGVTMFAAEPSEDAEVARPSPSPGKHATGGQRQAT